MRSVAFVVALVACAHAAAWALVRGQATAPDFDGQLASISYSPSSPSADPDSGKPITEDQIRDDLRVIAPYTRAIRTYSSTGGMELVPKVAAEFGLRVMVGAWITKDKDEHGNDIPAAKERNEREIRAVIDLAHRYSNINGIVVGNETIFRGDQTIPSLIEYIQRVKRSVSVPVSTGEIYSVWAPPPRDPKLTEDEQRQRADETAALVRSVDFIGAHILPYWEGLSEKQTVEQTVLLYDKLRQMYPGKRVLVAEFGWPSAGYNRRDANPGRLEQAEVLRSFVAKAEAYGIDYNIVEAIDQPWKARIEGGVGPYWGLFDTSLQPKFSWTGPIFNADHWKLATLSVLLGLLFSLPILGLAGATSAQALVLTVSANVIGAWIANVFAYWKGHYFVPGAAFALALGLLLLIPLIIIAFARLQEIAAIMLGRKPLRLVGGPLLAPAAAAPKVSIHIPAYREAPEMLKQTLDSVARLDYANFECMVVINNTPDPAFWQPIEEHCRLLGDRFKFVNVDNLSGFKAGALRLALTHTAPDAEIIGIIDADYVVHPDWLKDLVPLFADPKVGLVQAPQDHRDTGRSVMHEAMNGEYAGFFDIGMVQRNEDNAIIVHGTMCLIRRAAMDAAGGWSSDTICEDTDLGLSILEQGWVSHYTNRRYGHGLLPDTFEAFKKQRHRWAYGGLQIVKKHWRRFLPGESLLSRDQKRQYAIGWLSWLGAESVGVLVAIFNLLWVPVVAFLGIAVPDKILTIPIIAAFAISLTHFLALYRARVRISIPQMTIAIFAAMAVQWTVARAVGQGLVQDHLPFVTTAKGGRGRRGRDYQAFWEAVMGALLIIGAITLLATNYENVREINIFAAVLVLQSLPFLSAVAIASLEGSRLNDYAFWRTLEARATLLLPRRAAVAEVMADIPAAAPEQRIEAGE